MQYHSSVYTYTQSCKHNVKYLRKFCAFSVKLHRMITTFHGVTISASCTSTLRRINSPFYCAVFYPQERRTYAQACTTMCENGTRGRKLHCQYDSITLPVLLMYRTFSRTSGTIDKSGATVQSHWRLLL
jgi:hypothetical protein